MSNPRYLLILLFFVLSQPLILNAQPETTISGDVLHIKLPDALNALVMPIPQASNAEMIFYLQAGSALEGDSARGVTNLLVKIYGDKIAAALKKGRGPLNNQNVTFNSYCTTERAVFKFNLYSQNIPACLELIRDSLYHAKFSQAELNNARNYALQQIEDAKHDLKKVFQDKLLKGLYVQDHRVLETQGDIEELKAFGRSTLISSYEKYFAPK